MAAYWTEDRVLRKAGYLELLFIAEYSVLQMRRINVSKYVALGEIHCT